MWLDTVQQSGNCSVSLRAEEGGGTHHRERRYALEAKIGNVTFLSDYRGAEFGETQRHFLECLYILTRAVIVVDKPNIIRYIKITPELARFPTMEEALQFAHRLVMES